MSDIDLSAVTAALRGYEPSEYADVPELALDWRRRAAAAVYPVIERAVREQIARDIEVELDRDDAQKSTDFSEGLWTGLNNARHIAGGNSR